MNPTTTIPDPFNTPAGRLLHDPGPTLSNWAHQAWAAVAPWLMRGGLAVLFVTATALAARVLSRRHRAAVFARGARAITIAVPPEVDPAGAVTLWSNLVQLLRPPWRRLLEGQPHVAFELAWSQSGLRVSLWVPGPVAPGLVERAVEAAWPAARTRVAPASPPLPLDAPAQGGELRLAQPEWFPLRTDHPVDPLRSLLGAAGVGGSDEWAAVQVLARPVSSRRLARGCRAAQDRRSGQSSRPLQRFLDLVTPGPPPRPVTAAEDPTAAADVRAILDKTAGPGWEAVVRYGVAGGGGRKRLRGRAHAVASSFGVFAGRNQLSRHRLRHPAQAMACRSMGRGDLVSVAELSALAHLPTDVSVPGLDRAGARSVMPPPAVPEIGKVLGDADAGPRRVVALAPADACQHVHLMGATGSGKSTLLTNLVLGDVEAGRGVVVIDPKGDLVTDLLDRLPESVAEDRLVLLDPESADIAPALDVLSGDDHDLVVDHLVGIFRRIFESYWGPRTDDILRAACLTLLEKPGASLADVPLLLTDAALRSRYVAAIDDPVGLGGFWAWYDALSDAEAARVVGPAMNKLRAFLMRRFVRSVVGSGPAPLDMAKVLDGGLLLVRVPKGVLGDETARLLGSLVVARVWQAATARARAGLARTDASLYVDECHNFLNLPRSFEEMLAEARGYHLGMVLAHQHLAQLPRDLREAVSANARSKVFFSLSPEDAASLARHVEPDLSAHDLSHLGDYQAAARLVVGGRERAAFTLTTRPTPAAIPGRAAAIRAGLAARRPASPQPAVAGARVRLNPRLRTQR